MPKIEPDDPPQPQEQVQRRRACRHEEWCAGVLQSSQVSGACEHDHHRGHAEEADPQVDRGLGEDLAVGPHEPQQGVRERGRGGGDDEAQAERQPQALDRLVGGLAFVARPHQPRHRGGGAVGEEDEHRVAEQQDAAGHGQPGQGVGAQDPTHDGGVGQHVERFGHQRTEGRDGQAQDLAVERSHRGPRRPRRFTPRPDVGVAAWRRRAPRRRRGVGRSTGRARRWPRSAASRRPSR